MAVCLIGHALRPIRRQVDDDPHHGGWLGRPADNTDAADLDQAPGHLQGPRHQSAVSLFDPGAIIGDEPGEQPPRRRILKDLTREGRFTASGIAPDQDAGLSDDDGRGVDCRRHDAYGFLP